MLKFIRGKGQQPSAERVKLQKELYAFRRVSIMLIRLSNRFDFKFVLLL